MWYAAHLLSAYEKPDTPQNENKIREKIYLIHAGSSDDAFVIADKICAEMERSDTGDDNHDGKVIRPKCLGLRRLSYVLDVDEEDDLVESNMEISYLAYYVDHEKDIERLIEKRPVNVTFMGDDDD